MGSRTKAKKLGAKKKGKKISGGGRASFLTVHVGGTGREKRYEEHKPLHLSRVNVNPGMEINY